MATSDSNTTESFCGPRSWTNNLFRRHKRHRKYGKCGIYLLMVHLLFRGLKDSSENSMKNREKTYFFSLAGSLCPNCSFLAVLLDGSSLLNAGWGNLFFPVCCESLYYRHRNAYVSLDIMGYFCFACCKLL